VYLVGFIASFWLPEPPPEAQTGDKPAGAEV
jgi:hypothetical protein